MLIVVLSLHNYVISLMGIVPVNFITICFYVVFMSVASWNIINEPDEIQTKK